MRSTLLPLVERLGDPCQAVAASAELAVSVLCSACGYDGLRSLISSNIDYVVDGVCFQLREIDRHPRSGCTFLAPICHLEKRSVSLFRELEHMHLAKSRDYSMMIQVH